MTTPRALGDDVRALGAVSAADLEDLYAAAALLATATLFEGFGLPPVEAMACGCPVISSLRGSLEEVVGHAADPIDPDQPASIAAALTRVATDSTHRDALRERGFQNARRFDWDRNAEQVMAVYQGQRAAA